MTQKIKITVLVENISILPQLDVEHGLSFFIQTPNVNILFDTGQTNLLLKNAAQLKLDLKTTNAVVLSHGHYDHTGGLFSVLNQIDHKVDLYLHPAAAAAKFKRNLSGLGVYIGMPSDSVKLVKNNGNLLECHWTEKPTKLANFFTVTGPIPRQTDFENTGGPFFLDEAVKKEDLIVDDQAMFFESSKGLVIILGCAHAGVVNTLNYISKLAGQTKIYAVFGGMHLLKASDKRLKKTIDEFRKFEVKMIGPAHCTGPKATEKFQQAFPQAFFICNAGTIIEFESK